MSSITTRTARRSRRRLALWLGFGVVGLSMGAVWATGFATFSAGAGTVNTPAIVVPGSPTDAATPLAGDVVADSGAWTVTWNGLWGLSPAYNYFTVTTPASPADATYNIAMLLSNGASLTGAASWQSLQLKLWLVNAGVSGTCTGGTFPGLETTDGGVANPVTGGVARVFYFDNYDSAVYWNNTDADVGSDLTNQGTVTTGIIAGQKYCVGIQASNPENDTYDGAENTDGTVLRATGPDPSDVDYPQFIATLNRAS